MTGAPDGRGIERAREIFLQAAAQPQGERAAFIRGATDDPILQDVVLSLLAAVDSGDGQGDAFEDELALPEMALDEAGEALRLLWALPEVVGHWRLVRPLSASGRSLVYMAERVDDGSVCALKLLPPRDTDRPSPHWEREVETLKALKHTNIAPLLEASVMNIDGRHVPTVATELIDGIDVRRWVQEYAPSEGAICALMLEVIQAVAWLHEQGVIHGDLKPDNVLVATPEVNPRPVIVDFDSSLWASSRSARRGGTLAYCSPARLQGDSPVAADDQFSLGVMLYELLVGGHPYAARDDSRDVIAKRFWRGLEPLRLQRPATGRPLNDVVMAAMAINPAHRFPSVATMAEDLSRAMAGTALIHKGPPKWLDLRSAVRRNRRMMRSVAAVVTVASLGAVIASIFAVDAQRQRRATQLEHRTDRLDLATQSWEGGRLTEMGDHLQAVSPEDREWTWTVMDQMRRNPSVVIPMADDEQLALQDGTPVILAADGSSRAVPGLDDMQPDLRRAVMVMADSAAAEQPQGTWTTLPADEDQEGPWTIEHPSGWSHTEPMRQPNAQWVWCVMHTLPDGDVILDFLVRRQVRHWEYSLRRRLFDGHTGERKESMHWPMDSGPIARHHSGALIVVGRAGELAEIDASFTIRQRGNLPFASQMREMWISPDYQHLMVRTDEEVVVLDRYLLDPHLWLPLGDIPGTPLFSMEHVLVLQTPEGLRLQHLETEALNEMQHNHSYCTSLDRLGDDLLVARFFDTRVTVLDVHTGTARFAIPVDGARAACLLDGGGVAIADTWTDDLRIFDADRKEIDTLRIDHFVYPIRELRRLGDGRLLVRGAGSVSMIDMDTGLTETVAGEAAIDAAQWADDQTVVLWAGMDTRGPWVEVVETESTLVEDAGDVDAIATVPGDRLALIGRHSVTVIAEDGVVLCRMPGVDSPVHDAAFMTPGRLLVARQDGRIDVFDVDNAVRVGSIPAHEGYVYRLLPVDEQTLLSGGADGAVRRWQGHAAN